MLFSYKNHTYMNGIEDWFGFNDKNSSTKVILGILFLCISKNIILMHG